MSPELDEWTKKDLAGMKRTWTDVGKQVVGAALEDFDSGIASIDRAAIVGAIEGLEWHEIPAVGKLSAPAMPGLGISAAIEQLKVPKVSHVGWSSQLAPYGFYGIRGHYQNGDAEVYIVDMGTHLVPVCSDFTKKGCGRLVNVEGTNGGKMPCGAHLKDLKGTVTRYYCSDKCEQEAK